MEANKSECERCIRIAQNAEANDDYEKAIKFLTKAQRLYPCELVTNRLQEMVEKSKRKSSQSENNSENKSSNSDETSSCKNNSEGSNSKKGKGKEEEPMGDQDAVKRIKNCRDFYEILGVPKTASDADLRKAYKKLALKFHPDKNKTTGATEAFKAIGKAFSVLSDAQKRKQYDNCGPENFESNETQPHETYRHRSSYNTHYNNYWNDEDFSADELFNLFFGGNYSNSTNQRRRQAASHGHSMPNAHTNFVFTSSNNYAVLFQLMPILLIVILSLLSNFMMGEPIYSLQKTNKYSVRRTTNDHKISYYVKPDFKIETTNELNKVERQVEEDLLIELRQACFREKSYKETAIWRARNYGDERLLKKANEYETPSCNRINHIFGGG